MAERIEAFSKPQRATTHPYEEWLCGDIMRLEVNRDFFQTPQSLATSIRTHARRHEIPAVVRPVRDFKTKGKPFRFVEVWGDPNRSIDDGVPPEIQDML